MLYATGRTSLPVANVVLSTQRVMCKSMQVLQLNMQKRREVQHSVMNDERLGGYTALVVSEPYVFEMEGRVRTSPMGRHHWRPFYLMRGTADVGQFEACCGYAKTSSASS